MNLGFALEYSLGHTTHAQNLKRVLAGDAAVRPVYVDLPYQDTPGRWTRLPGVRSNWSVRASLGAYLGLRPQAGRLDAALFHTQVTSLFSAGLMRRCPSVISLDATPVQYDALGAFYGHSPSGNARIEALKKRLNMRAFGAARHLVAWSEWAKDSLITDYGVVPAKISVIPPGIDTALWEFPAHDKRPKGTVNVLFVGGDFARKGGDTLLAAFQALPPNLDAHLHLVTQTPDAAEGVPGVTIHRGLTANSAPLRRLFAEADLFAFPTRGDCLPLAVMEAMAAGLPVITTHVGALAEAVTDGHTGLIVPPDDPDALRGALTALIADPGLRGRTGRNAREAARTRFDAATNYCRLLGLVKTLACEA